MTLRSKIAAVPFAREAYRCLKKSVHRCGMPAMWQVVSGRRHAILTFHRIRRADQPADPFDTCPSVSADEFRKILEYTRKYFTVVSLRELNDRRADKMPLAAVTFDDGWRDNYDVAFPILRETAIPATIFVTTGKIGESEPFWQQKLGRLFRFAGDRSGEEASREIKTMLGIRNGRPLTPELYRDTVVQWKRIGKGDGVALNAVPSSLFEQEFSVHASDARIFLDSNEIREMAAAGIDFGSHTVNHAILTLLPIPEIDRELSDSKAALERLLGVTVDMLAYPDGQYSPKIVEHALGAGYRLAVTTTARRASKHDDAMLIPRLEASYAPLDDLYETINLSARSSRRERHADRIAVPTKKIKILFLIDEFEGPEGGTEQHMLFLQRELSPERFELHFGVLGGIRRMKGEDFPIKPVMIGEGTRPGIRGALSRLHRLAQRINEVDADIVHAFCRRSELYALLAVRLAGRAKVLGVRRNIGYWHNRRSRWCARLVGMLGAHYAANCQAAREFAAQVEWIPQRRITVIHNPVSTKRMEEGLANVPSRYSLGIHDDEQVVGMVAVVKPVKDYATFLRAAQLVLNQCPRTRFLAIGPQEPEYTAQMRHVAHELDIDKQVSWVGPISNPFSTLPLFDVAVLSSQSEAMSNSIVEYMAAGVPAVATDVGGTRELIDDGQTGFIVPPKSPEAIADRVLRLLLDKTLQSALGDNARRKVQAGFSETSIVGQYFSFYTRLASNNGKA